MKKLVKMFSMVLALVFILSIAVACTSKPPADEKVKIGFVVMDYANPYFVTLAEGFEARCKELGVEYTITDGKMDANAQINAIENYIASKVDVIICAPVDSKAIEPLVKTAHDAGIMFISEGEMIEGSDAFITIPEYEFGLAGGRLAGQWMKDNLTGPVDVAVLDLPELEVIIDRARGLADGVKEVYPEANIVANQSASTPETGMKATETILQAHPNVQVIVAINDAAALGAYEAFMSVGKDGDTFGVFGLDATQEAQAKIKEGGIYRGTIDTKPLARGGLDVDTALKILKEGPITETIIVQMFPLTHDNLK